jgi:hypothetical protein
MTDIPRRAAIMVTTLHWLRGGLLPSALPDQLMDEFGLSAEFAREIAWAAVRRWRAEAQPRRPGYNEGKESKKPGQPDNE